MIFKFSASLLIGFTIKLIDDYVDDELDYMGKNNIDKTILLYSILFIAIAAGIYVEYAVTLISACYMVGMFHDMAMKLPTRLRGYQESIIIFFINIYLFSFHEMITSFLAIGIIQLIDDLCDTKWDKKYGYKNFANQFGKVEIIIISLILTILLGMLDHTKLFIVMISYVLIHFIYKKAFYQVKRREVI
ncbi:hypothetical protein [Crassaminicella profunda]|uniref:hypothetical protein n=1 Tax=Crassaminicella profunda TaxID=1286698 RepID=UPI001CA67C19|nr:hypothetical protein [Crassaminicella profunda]QZY56910.1 hypothetical protein K7H06_08320 [Crassaminicella profunda]